MHHDRVIHLLSYDLHKAVAKMLNGRKGELVLKLVASHFVKSQHKCGHFILGIENQNM